MKRTLFFIYFLTYICVSSFASQEKNFIFRHYQVENGLSDNMVTCCIQDSEGYIWIGTRDGLNRFDGYSFNVYRHDPEIINTLGSNWITYLNCDQNGNLWVGTLSGLYSFDKKDKTFHQISFTANKRISLFQFDEKNRLWLLMDDNLIQYNMENEHINIISSPDKHTYTSFCITKDQEIWAGDDYGCITRISEQEEEIPFTINLFKNEPVKKILKLCPSSYSSDIYIAYEHDDIKIFNTHTHEYKDLNIQHTHQITFLINNFLEKNAKELWIGTDSGLLIYYTQTGECRRVEQDSFDPYALSSHYISAFCQDKEDGIWICFHQNGINYYSPYQPFRIHYPKNEKSGMKGEVVRDICTDKFGNLWVGTEDAGINCMEKGTGTFTNYQPKPGERSLSHTNIRGLASSGDQLWIGHVIHGIDCMDIKTRKVTKQYSLLKDSTSTKNSSVRCIKVLQEGQIYVGTDDGVYKYDYINDCFKFVPKFPSNSIRCIYEDRMGKIWVGTFNRSFYYNPISNTGMYLPYDKLNTQRHNFVNDICEDTEGNMWFATMEGVIKYDFQTGESLHYTVNEGMPSNVAFKILVDGEEYLWISTANGLVQLNILTSQIMNYQDNRGLITRQFNENSAFKDANGNFYFGSIKGFVQFNPDDVNISSQQVRVHLKSLDIEKQGGSLNLSDLPGDAKISLRHKESTFSINFSTLSFIAPHSIQYAYKMGDNHKEWIPIGTRNTVYFTDLHPGKYLFEVKATNLSNQWSNAVTQLEIEILPAWWASNIAKFFYLLLSILFVALIIYIVKKRARTEMTFNMRLFEDQKEKELYQAKIDFFINIAHEIRTPLTLIKNPLERILKSDKIPEKESQSLQLMDKNVSRLLSLVNQLLDFRKTEIEGYKLNFIRTNILDLLNETVKRFQESAAENGLLLNVDTNTSDLYAFIDREAITKIFSNLLVNALKYAQKSIIIRVQLNSDYSNMMIDFINDGSPIPEEAKENIFKPFYREESLTQGKTGTGLGLPMARSLAEMHHGTLTLTPFTDNPSLTMFRLTLPLNLPESIKDTEEETEKKETQPVEYSVVQGRPAILIVEDNQEMRNFIAEEINSVYNVFTAENGALAIDIVRHQSIQLIISDIMMPVMDGFELLKNIKTNIEFSHIPIILLTAKNTIQSRMEGLELGADAYIGKPFDTSLLMAQISNLITNRDHIRKFYFNSPLANMKSIAYNKTDENFLDKLNGIINEHIGDQTLDVNKIADLMNLSRPTLYRKIKSISALTPNELIKITRLKRAAELLIEGDMKIYEIAEMVGFSSQSYFWAAFIKQFGISPSQYAKENKEKQTTPSNGEG